jgi:hypothetical protein
MVPSVRAVMVGSTNVHVVGERGAVSIKERDALDSIRPNITVSGVSLSSSGNDSSISFTVTDNSNASADLQHLLVFGNFSTNVNLSAISHIINVTNVNISGTASEIKNITSREQEAETSITESEAATFGHFRVLNFLVSNNGTLLLPFSQLSATAAGASCTRLPPEPRSNESNGDSVVASERNTNSEGPGQATNPTESENSTIASQANDCIFNVGYVLNAHTSKTLSFDDPISMGFGRIILSFVSGNNYKLTLQGERGARAVFNATAT